MEAFELKIGKLINKRFIKINFIKVTILIT